MEVLRPIFLKADILRLSDLNPLTIRVWTRRLQNIVSSRFDILMDSEVIDDPGF